LNKPLRNHGDHHEGKALVESDAINGTVTIKFECFQCGRVPDITVPITHILSVAQLLKAVADHLGVSAGEELKMSVTGAVKTDDPNSPEAVNARQLFENMTAKDRAGRTNPSSPSSGSAWDS
jgi:hypothetical protein